MTKFIHLLRTGAFITEERLKMWPAMFLVSVVAGLAYMFATAHGLNDYKARPLGTDYSNVYAAGVYADKGEAAAPFDPRRQYAQEQAIFGSGTPFYGWHYPPFFLLIAAPLAKLPYLTSLVVWQVITLLLYLGALAMLLRRENPPISRRPLWILPALAFPAVFVNLIHGHNGFLTAALIAAGITLLDESPWLSGGIFGLLAYKPQFVFMIPLVLIVTARWRALVAFAAMILALGCITTAIFGIEIWPAFLASTHFTRTVVLEQGAAGFHKIQSVFAWVRMWGGPVWLAYALQAATTLTVGVGLALIWRSPASRAVKGAALCLGSLLSTPYCLDYDLMVLAPAIAFMAAQGCAQGFAPYEKTLLAGLWLVPAVARAVAGETSIPLAAPAMLCAFAYVAIAALRAQRPIDNAVAVRECDACGMPALARER